MSWLLRRRKQNIERSELALDLFKQHKEISRSSMERYEKTLRLFAEFLLTKRKSLLDANVKDVYEFLEGKIDERPTEKAIISSFYRMMIRLGHFENANPVAELPEYLEKLEKKGKIKRKQVKEEGEEVEDEGEDAASELESLILSGLGEADTTEEPKKKGKKKPKFRRLMSAQDFENLILRTSHIRDRTVLELLWWTGIRPLELCELRIEDVDLNKRRIYLRGPNVVERTVLINRRLKQVLERYLEWRKEQLSPTNHLIITPRSKEPMTSSALAGHLSRLQRGVPRSERFTTKDFRRRAIINYYYMTRDIIATHRFAGTKNPAATMKIINDILEEREVNSIEELAELTEFKDGLVLSAHREDEKKDKSDLKKKPQRITILLTPEEQEMIRKAGVTPALAIKGILSLRELYQQLAPQVVSSGRAPMGQPLGNIPSAPRPSGAPRSRSPSIPKTPRPPGGGLPKGPGGASGPAAYISELKEILKKRRQISDAAIAEQEKKEAEMKEGAQETPSVPPPPVDGPPAAGPKPTGKIVVKKDGPNAPKL